jgi:hypothetical protein
MRATELFARHPELKSEFQAIINSKINTTWQRTNSPLQLRVLKTRRPKKQTRLPS